MKRKVIQLGTSTLVTSLPSKWIKANDIKPGDELNLEVSDTGLSISTGKQTQRTTQKYSIDYEQSGQLTKRLVGALYKAGYDEIEINIPSKSYSEVADIIMIRELDGFEIISQTPKGIVLKSISEHKSEEFENALRRMFTMVVTTFREARDAIIAKDHNLLNNFNERDIPINKVSNYCRRMINRQEGVTKKSIPFLYYLIEELENIGDEIRDMAKCIGSLKSISMSSAFMKELEETIDLLEEFFTLYRSFTISRANDYLNNIKASLKSAKNSQKRESIILEKIKKIIYNMHGPLMTMHCVKSLQRDESG